jgi:glycosyltransferase involved in cell wall biosynthesis
MKVAFYVPNQGIKNIDFSHPQNGNPGTGAAEYLHVALPYFLNSSEVTAFIYAQKITSMPSQIRCVECGSIRDAAIKAKENGIDFFVFRPRIHEEDNILDLIDELKLCSIGRAALTPSVQHQRKMAKSEYLKALVAVGSEQYDFLCDSPVSPKLTYIDNGISFSATQKYSNVSKNINLVTYMGAIVPQKGFHVLAKIWPEVSERHPNAELRVIGSSKIYNENYLVGQLGIADKDYEEKYIIPYLCDSERRLLPSVKFLGGLGEEKYSHLTESIVSVPNPTGQTETCCVSAIEMQACGAAVVTGAYYALLGSVQHQETGLLGRGEKMLINNICYLLSNPEIAIELGKKGKKKALEQYDFEVVVKNWKLLFHSIYKGTIWKPKHQFKYLRYHRKWLRLVNYFFLKTAGVRLTFLSVQELEAFLIRFVHRLK